MLRSSLVRLLILLLFLPACGSEVCEEAYDKISGCLAKLECNKLDPLEYPRCVSVKNKWAGIDKSTFVLACKQSSAEADKILACTFNRTCECP